jgi:hypothetical protein
VEASKVTLTNPRGGRMTLDDVLFSGFMFALCALLLWERVLWKTCPRAWGFDRYLRRPKCDWDCSLCDGFGQVKRWG